MHQGQGLPRHSNLSERISAIHASHETFDLWPARPDEIVEARDFAANLIGGKNVEPSTLAWVHERTGGCLFLAREDGQLTGVWASVLLSPAGVQACHEDRFDGLDPDPRHVAERHQDPAGHYAWGIAGSTKASARRVVGAADALFWTVLSHLPFFTRPATPAGVRLVVERLDFRPVPGSKTGIVWREPRTARTSVAA